MRKAKILLWAAGLAAAVGCETEFIVLALRCDVTLESFDGFGVHPGGKMTVRGSPLTSVWDTAVYVDGTRATVTDVTRTDCEDCDECREAESCSGCGDCDECDLDCTTVCIEEVTFTIPDLSPGVKPVTLYNRHGHSTPLNVQVLPGPHTVGDDPGSADTAEADDSGE